MYKFKTYCHSSSWNELAEYLTNKNIIWIDGEKIVKNYFTSKTEYIFLIIVNNRASYSKKDSIESVKYYMKNSYIDIEYVPFEEIRYL